jgi:hypothetical protein
VPNSCKAAGRAERADAQGLCALGAALIAPLVFLRTPALAAVPR